MSATAKQVPGGFPALSFSDRGFSRTAQVGLSLLQLQEQIVALAELPLARASTLPAQAYTSEEFFDFEVEHLLRRGWQCLAHVSQIPNNGDFLNLDLLGEPLIVVRDKAASVRVLSRVCPHRAMDIMPQGFGYSGHGPAEVNAESESCGHTRIFLCPYHAWTFELDGKLKACPEMHQAECFHRDDFGLKPFRCEIVQGFIFVNLSGNAEPLADGLTEFVQDVAAFQIPEMKIAVAREWECDFNWKVLVENFMESYHHLGIHHRTLQPMMPARDTWTEQERGHYIRAHLPYKDTVREAYLAFAGAGEFAEEIPPVPGTSDEQRTEWGLFLIHPTTLIATAPDRVIWYRVQPLGPNRLKILTTALVPANIAARPDFPLLREKIAQALTEFHLEDMEVCTAVQRGMYASGWQPGRLSHLEMPVWLFHRYIAARIQGCWPTDKGAPAPSQKPAPL